MSVPMQAYRYAFPGASADVKIGSKDYQGLSTANAELLNKVKTELTLQGGNSHAVNELPSYVVNSTLPGFADLLKPGGRFTFYISPDDPLFYNLVCAQCHCITLHHSQLAACVTQDLSCASAICNIASSHRGHNLESRSSKCLLV